MLVYVKMLYNGAEGAVLENSKQNLKIATTSLLFSGSGQKNFQGGVEVPGGAQ